MPLVLGLLLVVIAGLGCVWVVLAMTFGCRLCTALDSVAMDSFMLRISLQRGSEVGVLWGWAVGSKPRTLMVVGDVRKEMYLLRISARRVGLPPSISLVASVTEQRTPATCWGVGGCLGCCELDMVVVRVKEVGSVDILCWAMQGTCEHIYHNFPHWTEQGLDHHKRFTTYENHRSTRDLNVSQYILAST